MGSLRVHVFLCVCACIVAPVSCCVVLGVGSVIWEWLCPCVSGRARSRGAAGAV